MFRDYIQVFLFCYNQLSNLIVIALLGSFHFISHIDELFKEKEKCDGVQQQMIIILHVEYLKLCNKQSGCISRRTS